MEDVIEYQVTGGYSPPEEAIPTSLLDELRENGRLEQYQKMRASNASLAKGHQRMQLEIRSLQQENATLREQVTELQAQLARMCQQRDMAEAALPGWRSVNDDPPPIWEEVRR